MKKIYILLAIVIALVSFSLRTATNAAKPTDFGLKEGDLISAIFSDDPDVYIVNDRGYKRLFLNPEIFKFYGHLGGFVNVKLVTPEVRDSFITSGLFRNCEDNDQKVYGVDIEGEDSGELHWVNSSGEQAVKDDPDFFKKVFCINSKEFNWYPRGNVLNTVKDVPKYERMEAKEAISTERKLETNTPLKEEGKVVICHYPPEAPNKFLEITIDASALKEHLAHGDSVGTCPGTVPTSKSTCLPRPACLDATPRCLLSEPIGGWCPIQIGIAVPAPSPTTMPVPTSFVAPSPITVVSPNGGEVFQKGTTQLIKWNSANVSKIYIKLRKGNDTYPGPEGMITDVIPSIGGYYKWWIPTTLPDGNDYSVRVIDGNFTGVLDDSDKPFSIVTTATPTITPVPTSTPVQQCAFTGTGCCTIANPNQCVVLPPNVSCGTGLVPKVTGCISGGCNAAFECVPSPTSSPSPLPSPSPTPTPTPTLTPTVLPPGAECKPGETKDYTCSDGTIIPLWGKCDYSGKWYYDEQMWAIAWAAGSLKDPMHDIAKVCPAPGDITPPVISNISIVQDNQPLVGIMHDTNEPAYSWLEYGLTTSYGYKTQPDTRLKVSQHTDFISITILKSNTTYHYRVVDKDLKGNTAYSGDNTFTTPAPTTQSNFLRNLTMGSAGNDVKQLQALLVNEVSYPADLLTGYFGRITRDAVKRFQEKYGVKPISGYFGEITRRALNALISN